MCVRTHIFLSLQPPREHVMTTTAQHTPTRSVGGHVVPATGTWEIDPGHTDLAFVGRHFMLTKVRGRFTGVTGSVVIAEDLADSRVDVTIDMATVESGSTARDEHIRSAELFDVERFPQATFRSTEVDWDGAAGRVTGELTIHGVTRTVTLEVAFEGYARDPWGGD